MNSQLQLHLYNTNVLKNNQFRFVKNKSTSQAVFKLSTDLYDNVDRKKDNLTVGRNLQYKNQMIETVSESNYLGIELDDKLTMENHINKSVNKANTKLYMIYKIRRCLSKRNTSLLYKQLVRPHLENCDFVIDM